MALSEDKVRMSASITVDRFGKKALKEKKEVMYCQAFLAPEADLTIIPACAT